MGSGVRGGGKRRGVCEAEEVQCVERESGVVCRCVLFCGLRCNNMTMTTIPTGQEYRSKPRKSSLRLRTRRKECTASHANTAISNRLLAHAKRFSRRTHIQIHLRAHSSGRSLSLSSHATATTGGTTGTDTPVGASSSLSSSAPSSSSSSSSSPPSRFAPFGFFAAYPK